MQSGDKLTRMVLSKASQASRTTAGMNDGGETEGKDRNQAPSRNGWMMRLQVRRRRAVQ